MINNVTILLFHLTQLVSDLIYKIQTLHQLERVSAFNILNLSPFGNSYYSR